jgi:hypothetical protein
VLSDIGQSPRQFVLAMINFAKQIESSSTLAIFQNYATNQPRSIIVLARQISLISPFKCGTIVILTTCIAAAAAALWAKRERKTEKQGSK